MAVENEKEPAPQVAPMCLNPDSVKDVGRAVGRTVGRYRWVICALLFFATTINYIDRGVLAILEPTLAGEFGWTKEQYGYVNSAFNLMYGVGFLVMGWVIDRIGVKRGFSLGVIIWSFASMGHALARSVWGLAGARAVLGIGESVNFPCAVKAVAEWFPKKERALATGIFNAGSNVGNTITPLIVPLVTLHYGWRAAFVVTGVFGLIWLAFWLIIYKPVGENKKVSAEELAYIRSTEGEEAADLDTRKVRWRQVVGKRQAMAFAVGKFLTDPAWWFFLFWLAPILDDKFKLNIKQIGWPLFTVYVLADVGSVLGGWFSSRMLRKGYSTNMSRKMAMLACALCVVPIALVPQTTNLWTAVILIGIAAGAHQGWSCNLFTLVSDTFPRRAVGSVVGFGGLMGALGGALFQPYAGRLRDLTGSYAIPLYMISGVYLVTLLIIHVLMPRMRPAELRD